MPRRYEPPRCTAVDEETGQPCGVRMSALGERDPSFGPSYVPGCWVFRCRRCGSLRAVDKQLVGRYMGPV